MGKKSCDGTYIQARLLTLETEIQRLERTRLIWLYLLNHHRLLNLKTEIQIFETNTQDWIVPAKSPSCTGIYACQIAGFEI